jgi:fibulin 1/2
LPNACVVDKPFCVNTQGSYTCLEMTGVKSCPAGFKFDKSLQQCKGNADLARLIDLDHSDLFGVSLMPLLLLVRSSDVDECAEEIHSCLADVEQCRNTEGAYECDVKCEKGFKYSNSLDICVGE